MRAIFQVIANAQDITELLKDRLLSLELTDRVGLQLDECEIRLDDRTIASPSLKRARCCASHWVGRGRA